MPPAAIGSTPSPAAAEDHTSNSAPKLAKSSPLPIEATTSPTHLTDCKRRVTTARSNPSTAYGRRCRCRRRRRSLFLRPSIVIRPRALCTIRSRSSLITPAAIIQRCPMRCRRVGLILNSITATTRKSGSQPSPHRTDRSTRTCQITILGWAEWWMVEFMLRRPSLLYRRSPLFRHLPSHRHHGINRLHLQYGCHLLCRVTYQPVHWHWLL